MSNQWPQALLKHSSIPGSLDDPEVVKDALARLAADCLDDICGPSDPIQPGDVRGEVYSRLEEIIPRFISNFGSTLEGFAYGICKKVVQEHERAHWESLKRARPSSDWLYQDAEQIGRRFKGDRVSQRETDEIDQKIRMIYSVASAREKEILDLYLENPDIQTIAEKLQLENDTIYQAFSRIRRKILKM